MFGFLEVAKSRSGFSADIPVHLFAGARPGLTLLVEAAVHGNEIIGTIGILNVVEKLDPAQMSGNLIAVPVLNRLGFELQDRGSRIDGRDLLRLFPGKPRGGVNDQLVHHYFNEVVKQADVMIDFHAGGRTAYERYVLFAADRDPKNRSPIEQARRKLVVAFGLDSAAFFPRGIFTGTDTEDSIEEAGVVMFQPELGGGTGWLANGQSNVAVAERGIWNVMKAMGILEGQPETDGPTCTIYDAAVVLWKPPVDGLFIRKKGFGELVKEGEIYGVLQDPYTGDELGAIPNTREATVIPSGQNWPTVGSTSVGILGTVDEVVNVRQTDLRVKFDKHG
jgi:predicted deacylase